VVIGNTNHYSSCVSKNNYFGILILLLLWQIIVLFGCHNMCSIQSSILIWIWEASYRCGHVATLASLCAISFVRLRTNSILDFTKIFEKIVLHCLIMALNSVTYLEEQKLSTTLFDKPVMSWKQPKKASPTCTSQVRKPFRFSQNKSTKHIPIVHIKPNFNTKRVKRVINVTFKPHQDLISSI
jgi:hypothetical protein